MLDSPDTYRVLDPDDVLHGVEGLAEQLRTAWAETRRFHAPSAYRASKSIVALGMGGSALAPEMIAGFGSRLRVPLHVVRDYAIPSALLAARPLVVLSSFSGTTEEVLVVAEEVKKRKLKVLVIASGGALVDIAKANRWPLYVFTPGDLAKEPRLGLGFSLGGMLGMLASLHFVDIDDRDVRRMLAAMGEVLDECAVDVATDENPAKVVAEALAGEQICVVAAEHLLPNAHVLVNQINETAKQFAFPLALPELNHHFLEASMHPKGWCERATVLMLRSNLYHSRTQKRFAITADMFEHVGMTVVEYDARGKDTLEECAEVLQFGSFASYYIAIANNVNPRTTLYVNEFKRLMVG